MEGQVLLEEATAGGLVAQRLVPSILSTLDSVASAPACDEFHSGFSTTRTRLHSEEDFQGFSQLSTQGTGSL